MGYVAGVIDKVFSKEIPEDKYNNKYRRAIRLVGDERWFGLGAGKTPAVNCKDGKQFRELHEGSEVEFVYSEREGNGTMWYDAKVSDIKVRRWGEGKAGYSGGSPSPERTERPSSNAAPSSGTVTQAPRASVSNASSGVDWARKDAGAAASASVDKAILALAYAGELADGINMDRIKELARTMQDAVVELAEEILSKGTKPPANETAKAPPKPASKPKSAAPKLPPKNEAEVDDQRATERSWEEEPEELPF